MVSPILKYPGGKMRELPIIKNSIPHFTNYYEPFLGGGALWLNTAAKHYYVNDFSADLMRLYGYIQEKNIEFEQTVLNIDSLWGLENVTEFIINNSNLLINYGHLENYFQFIEKHLEKKLKLFQGSYNIFDKKLKSSFLRKQNKYFSMDRDEIIGIDDIAITVVKDAIYQTIRELYNTTKNPIQKTAFYWFLREFSYSSMFRFNSKGGFNVPYGGKSYNNKFLASKLTQALSIEVTEKLNKTTLSNNDFQVFLDIFQPTSEDFVFLDPPYDSEFSTYDQNTFDQNEQIRLANYLKKELQANFMLVIKETDFIRSLYPVGDKTLGGQGRISIIDFEKQYQVSFKNRNNKNTNHLMITNYEVN